MRQYIAPARADCARNQNYFFRHFARKSPNNSGTFGTLFSYSVINPGQAGILTMEAITKRPVVRETPVLVTDDAGGAYAAWDEYQYPYLAHEGLNVMRLTRLLPGGVAGIDPPLPQRTALSLAVANPALGRFTISPMLPDERAARLEMFDLAGRVEFRRDLQGAGPHVVTIGAGVATPGVHWLRLSHPLGVRLARVVVLR